MRQLTEYEQLRSMWNFHWRFRQTLRLFHSHPKTSVICSTIVSANIHYYVSIWRISKMKKDLIWVMTLIFLCSFGMTKCWESRMQQKHDQTMICHRCFENVSILCFSYFLKIEALYATMFFKLYSSWHWNEQWYCLAHHIMKETDLLVEWLVN